METTTRSLETKLTSLTKRYNGKNKLIKIARDLSRDNEKDYHYEIIWKEKKLGLCFGRAKLTNYPMLSKITMKYLEDGEKLKVGDYLMKANDLDPLTMDCTEFFKQLLLLEKPVTLKFVRYSMKTKKSLLQDLKVNEKNDGKVKSLGGRLTRIGSDPLSVGGILLNKIENEIKSLPGRLRGDSAGTQQTKKSIAEDVDETTESSSCENSPKSEFELFPPGTLQKSAKTPTTPATRLSSAREERSPAGTLQKSAKTPTTPATRISGAKEERRTGNEEVPLRQRSQTEFQDLIKILPSPVNEKRIPSPQHSGSPNFPATPAIPMHDTTPPSQKQHLTTPPNNRTPSPEVASPTRSSNDTRTHRYEWKSPISSPPQNYIPNISFAESPESPQMQVQADTPKPPIGIPVEKKESYEDRLSVTSFDDSESEKDEDEGSGSDSDEDDVKTKDIVASNDAVDELDDFSESLTTRIDDNAIANRQSSPDFIDEVVQHTEKVPVSEVETTLPRVQQRPTSKHPFLPQIPETLEIQHETVPDDVGLKNDKAIKKLERRMPRSKGMPTGDKYCIKWRRPITTDSTSEKKQSKHRKKSTIIETTFHAMGEIGLKFSTVSLKSGHQMMITKVCHEHCCCEQLNTLLIGDLLEEINNIHSKDLHPKKIKTILQKSDQCLLRFRRGPLYTPLKRRDA